MSFLWDVIRRYRVLIVLIALAGCVTVVHADDVPQVTVKFDRGEPELDIFKDDVHYFTNREYPIQNIPEELMGLTFTRSGGGARSFATIDAPASSTIYVLVNTNPALIERLKTDGWTKIDNEAFYIENHRRYSVAILKISVDKPSSLSLTRPEWGGFVVASKNLVLAKSNIEIRPDDKKVVVKPEDNPSTRPVMLQSSIKALEVYVQESGTMLGQTSEITLTLHRTKAPQPLEITFTTNIGNQMQLAVDEAMRFIHVTWPNWNIDKGEISFEDKYVNHDGGSIGTAIGTLVLSTINGTTIDPDIAITGDISANGKVRAIGGVAAKLRGAIASKCTLVAIPLENEQQVIDGVIYNGNSLVTNIQVIGIANLSDAVAVMRTDRDDSLKQAIELFATIQKSVASKPESLNYKANRESLDQVLKLAPNHLSAKILSMIAQGKMPRTLSATASVYYTTAAVSPMIDVLKASARIKSRDNKIPTATIQKGLNDLKKLRPMADPKVRPLIDNWSRFIETWSAFQDGRASPEALEKQRLSLVDELTKEQADVDMMQKMLKEGI